MTPIVISATPKPFVDNILLFIAFIALHFFKNRK